MARAETVYRQSLDRAAQAAIDARSEVMGPFEPPADAALLPEFIAGLRATLVKRLAELRSGQAPPA